jgi:glycosyltransferase involved in cell wall biosynthesis
MVFKESAGISPEGLTQVKQEGVSSLPYNGVSVVIPAFNESESIGQVLDGLIKTLRGYPQPFEIIVIDDGSLDRTAEIAAGFPVRLLQHRVNKGYGASLKTGVRAACYELIAMIDSDGQHNPADLMRLIEAACQADMVVGARGKSSHAPALRKPGKWLLQKVANYLAGMSIPDLNSGLRVFQRKLILRFAHILPNGFSFTTTLTLAALKENYLVVWSPITVTRRSGKSSVNIVGDGYNTLILILRTIVLFDPLKVFLPPSLFLFIFGVLFSLYGVFRYQSVPESGVISIISAVLLFFLGILADSISSLRMGMRE